MHRQILYDINNINIHNIKINISLVFSFLFFFLLSSSFVLRERKKERKGTSSRLVKFSSAAKEKEKEIKRIKREKRGRGERKKEKKIAKRNSIERASVFMCAWRVGETERGLSGKHKNSNVSFIEHVYISDKGTRLIPIDCRDAENIENFKASFFLFSLPLCFFCTYISLRLYLYRACARYMHLCTK